MQATFGEAEPSPSVRVCFVCFCFIYLRRCMDVGQREGVVLNYVHKLFDILPLEKPNVLPLECELN